MEDELTNMGRNRIGRNQTAGACGTEAPTRTKKRFWGTTTHTSTYHASTCDA